jgi:hypothetical protein
MSEPVASVPYTDAALSSALWRAAKNWLVVWAGAGFVPTIKDGKFMMPKKWLETFPDGPHLLEAMRAEFTALVKDGNKAILADPRLDVAYPDFLQRRHDDEELRLWHARRCVARAQETLATIEAQQAAHKAGVPS